MQRILTAGTIILLVIGLVCPMAYGEGPKSINRLLTNGGSA